MPLMNPKCFPESARAFIASRLSVNTRSAYAEDLKEWLTFCREHKIEPGAASSDDAVAFRDHLRTRLLVRTDLGKGRKLSTASIARKLAALSGMYRWALEQQNPAAKWNPFTKRALPRAAMPSAGVTPPVDDEIAQKMIKAAEEAGNLRDATILALLYATGVRRISVASMRRAGVFVRDGVTIARVLVKGGREEVIEIPTPVDAMLHRWIEQSSGVYVFPGRVVGRHLNPVQINAIVERWAYCVGAKGVHPHCFRVTFVTSLYNEGVRERDIQAAVHHKDPSSTQRYDRGTRGGGVTQRLSDIRTAALQKETEK